MKAEEARNQKLNYVWASLRILLGLILLWAFFDKMFGLGFATCRTVDAKTNQSKVQVMCDKAAVKGGSATTGFLKFKAGGPLKGMYKAMAGNHFIDFLFMAALSLVGLSLISGIGVRVAAVSGSVLFLMMWLALLPGENNPLLDEHIIYITALIGIYIANDQQVLGFGKWWQKQKIVKKYPFLA